MSKCPLIAKAIVYAARQAAIINTHGLRWEDIETNTANILAGCSVPADGKMNSAEAVANTTMERLRTQADTPSTQELLQRGIITPNEARDAYALHANPTFWTVRRVTIPSWRGPGQPRAIRHELIDDNGRIVGNIRNERVAHEVARLVNSGGAVALELVDKYHAQKLELARANTYISTQTDDITSRVAQVDRLMGERDEALSERDDTLKVLDAMRDDLKREQAHASRWRETALGTAKERDEALSERDEINHQFQQLKASMSPHAAYALVEDLQADVVRLQTDRDEALSERDAANRNASERAVERNAAERKVVKLRTFLQGLVCNPWDGITNAINTILEQTK